VWTRRLQKLRDEIGLKDAGHVAMMPDRGGGECAARGTQRRSAGPVGISAS
jgi:hypothetical protein